MSRSRLALLLVLLVPGAAFAEQFYKWKDESGAWNYTEQPPKDKPSVAVNLATGAAGLSAAAQPPEGDAGATPAESRPAGQPSAEMGLAQAAEARAKIKAEQNANCERARVNVATLENNSRVTLDRNDGAGERVLNDDEQMQELVKARRQVEVFCGRQ